MPNAQIETELRVEKRDITKLEFADYNPRTMTDEARTGLNESLDSLGLLELPIINEMHDPPRISLLIGDATQETVEAYSYTLAKPIVLPVAHRELELFNTLHPEEDIHAFYEEEMDDAGRDEDE